MPLGLSLAIPARKIPFESSLIQNFRPNNLDSLPGVWYNTNGGSEVFPSLLSPSSLRPTFFYQNPSPGHFAFVLKLTVLGSDINEFCKIAG